MTTRIPGLVVAARPCGIRRRLPPARRKRACSSSRSGNLPLRLGDVGASLERPTGLIATEGRYLAPRRRGYVLDLIGKSGTDYLGSLVGSSCGLISGLSGGRRSCRDQKELPCLRGRFWDYISFTATAF